MLSAQFGITGLAAGAQFGSLAYLDGGGAGLFLGGRMATNGQWLVDFTAGYVSAQPEPDAQERLTTFDLVGLYRFSDFDASVGTYLGGGLGLVATQVTDPAVRDSYLGGGLPLVAQAEIDYSPAIGLYLFSSLVARIPVVQIPVTQIVVNPTTSTNPKMRAHVALRLGVMYWF